MNNRDPINEPASADEIYGESGGGSGSDVGVARAAPLVATNDVDPQQILQFVTTIKNAEQQIGEHILKALQHGDTVAVLTTVVLGPDGSQRIVSAALNPQRLSQVNELLLAAQTERQEQEPCVGFHCLVKPKQMT